MSTPQPPAHQPKDQRGAFLPAPSRDFPKSSPGTKADRVVVMNRSRILMTWTENGWLNTVLGPAG
jgi:hypothetical protein